MEVWILERSVKKAPVRVSPEGEKYRDKMLAERRCLGCGEKITDKDEANQGIRRGLHIRCYRAYTRAVDRGDTTERDAVRAGLLLEPNPGRKLSNPMAVKLAGK